MPFNNHKCRDIIIDHEDNEWIYLSHPENLRVNKSTHKIEKFSKGEYREPKVSWCGAAKYKYPAISSEYKMWSIQRILAVLFVPNPHGFQFLKADDPYDTSTMRWVLTPARAEESTEYTSTEERREALEGLDSSSKEYFRAYNKIKGSDGLTNTQRYVARKREQGLVLLAKKYSPTGSQQWITPELKNLVLSAFYDGSILVPVVRNRLIDEINKMPRINKPYKRDFKPKELQ